MQARRGQAPACTPGTARHASPARSGEVLAWQVPCAAPADAKALFESARREMAAKRRGQPAAQRIIDCVEVTAP